MIKVKGLDHGYHYTKDNEMRIFKSAYTRTDTTISAENKLIINGNTYFFGKGSPRVDEDKIEAEINNVTTWGNLVLSGDGVYNLVVGLPIGQYESKNERFKEMVMSYNNDEVIYKDKKVDIKINDVTVFAQGAGVLFNYPIPDNIYCVFDVGSYTINVVLLELVNGIPSIIKFNTWYDGVLTLYETIISETNRKYGVTLDFNEVNYIFKYGLSVRGTKKDTKYIDVIKSDYLDNILTKFKLNYKSYSTTPIILCGGGGKLIQELFEGYLNNAILMPDSQFANAIGYYNFGLQKYGC